MRCETCNDEKQPCEDCKTRNEFEQKCQVYDDLHKCIYCFEYFDHLIDLTCDECRRKYSNRIKLENKAREFTIKFKHLTQ